MGFEEQFRALVDAFAGEPGVVPPEESGRRRFGSAALTVEGRIFALLVGGRLVVKLPRERVEALIAAGTGGPFAGGKGRPMKEWTTVVDDEEATWLALAREALAFVRSG